MVNSFLAFAFKLGEFSFQFFPALIVFITVSFTNKKKIFEEEIFHNDITTGKVLVPVDFFQA